MHTPKSYTLLVLTAALLTINGCDKNEQSQTENSFPLAVSNSWQYFTETQIGTYHSSFVSYWQVLQATIINGNQSFKISQRDSLSSGGSHQAYSYYTNKNDGLYAVAVEGGGSSFIFKNEEENWPLMNSFNVAAYKTDSLFIPDTSLYLLRFPVVIGETWRSNEFGPSANIKRRWLSDETISTPAGSFNCNKLEIIFDYNDDGITDPGEPTIFQHFCNKGLVQEEQSRTLISIDGDTSYFHRITKLTNVNF